MARGLLTALKLHAVAPAASLAGARLSQVNPG
jgi:hypothetical protein